MLNTLKDTQGCRLKRSTTRIKSHKLYFQRTPLNLKDRRRPPLIQQQQPTIGTDVHSKRHELEKKNGAEIPCRGLTTLRSAYNSLAISDLSSMGRSVTLPFHFLKPNCGTIKDNTNYSHHVLNCECQGLGNQHLAYLKFAVRFS